MAGHSSIPDAKYSQRIFCEHGRTIKNHIPQPATNQNAEERRVKNKVAHLLFPERAVAAACKPLHQVKSREKTCDIGDSIPAYAKLLIELNQERAEMMNVKAEEHLMNLKG